MANATAYTPEVIAAALVNSPINLATRKKNVLEKLSYATMELAADRYWTVLEDGKVKRFGYVVDQDGVLQREPSIAQQDSADGKTKAGEQYKDRNGNLQFRPTGQYIEDGHGNQIKMYDSILDRLTNSSDPADVMLLDALTSNKEHDIFFSGAISVQVKTEVINAERNYKRPRLVLA